MRSLEKECLLRRGEPVRGKVGQPSVPIRLNPDAVYSFGVKIGRRSADPVLMDFVGRIRLQHHENYPYPPQDQRLRLIPSGITPSHATMEPGMLGALAGIGTAAQLTLCNSRDGLLSLQVPLAL